MKQIIILLSILMITFSSCDFQNKYEAEKLNQQGLNYLLQKRYLESRICFIKASEIEGIILQNKTQYLRNAAVVYTESFMADSARFYYFQAAKLNPTDSYNYNVNMADVYIIDENYTKAIQCLEKAWVLNKNELAVNNTLGLMYMGEYDTTIYNPELALKYNIKSHEINNDRNTKFVLAKNYFLISDFSNSEILFADLYREYPEDIDYLMTLILIAQEINDVEKEEKLLKELKIKDKDNYDYFVEAK